MINAKLFYSSIIVFSCIQSSDCDTSKNYKNENEEKSISKTATMKLKITIGEKTATAILYDNPTSRDFASLLPLILELEDNNNTEKIVTLSKKLSKQNAPAGFDPSIGDITYYAPWGNIALFYKDFGYSNGLISLGKITSGIEMFDAPNSLKIKIELEK
jgi:hypothetical protein